MKFPQVILCLLFSVSSFAGTTDTVCETAGSSGATVQFDIVMDGTTGALYAFTARHIPAAAVGAESATSTATTPNDQFDFPLNEIPNFWVDSGSLKLRGYSSDTQTSNLLFDYNKKLQIGRVTMNMPGYVLDNQVITCIHG